MTPHNQKGVALITALLVTALISALLVGFIATVMADQHDGFTNRDQTASYAAAHAGLEQLTSDLGDLFATTYRPTTSQVTALAESHPALSGISFNGTDDSGAGYRITFQDTNPSDGYPDTESTPRTITSGPYQGLMGTVTPYTIEVTANTMTGAETRMRRTMQTVLIPVFQFGIFSENDLSFHAGPSFDFGGRVHTNGNLYLAEGTGNTLWLRDRITAVGEVVRRNLVNGWPTSSGYSGTVRIARTTNDTTGASMGTNDQSWSGSAGSVPPAPVPGVTPSPGSNDPAWTTFSVTTAQGNIKNARTGAKPLVLPITQMGAQPIDLVRRPAVSSAEDVVNPPVFGQRYFARASLRILLSDTAADITNLPTVTQTAPVDLSTLAGTAQAPPNPAGCFKAGSTSKYTTLADCGLPALPNPLTNYYPPSGSWMLPGTPLVTGFLKIELQRADTTWVDVTNDILALGFTGRRLSQTNPPTSAATNFKAPVVHVAGSYYMNDTVFGTAPNAGAQPPCAEPNPNAVIRIQRVRDDHSPSVACGINSPYNFDYVPNALFDVREGDIRAHHSLTTDDVFLGGVMNYVELDVNNLARWFAGQIGAGGFGPQSEFSDGGYVVYFSDRRTNQRVNNLETAEYGFEDFVNPADATNGAPNGVLDNGEDVNFSGALDTYGGVPFGDWLNGLRLRGAATSDGQAITVNNTRPDDRATSREARVNPALFFRRALKIVNAAGTAANAAVSPLTLLPSGRGLTIVAENPVYVQGNYNTGIAGTFGSTQNDHRPSAVIADAITLLSGSWNDIRSFTYNNGGTKYGAQDLKKRPASETWYRMGVASGKGRTFQHPSWETDDESFGSDGGAHNFLRYIEDWLTAAVPVHYRGSMVSFYTSRQATGTFKYTANTYGAPVRDFKFDTEFLQLSLLPPKSPAFRDVNTLTFQQTLRPTQ